MLCSVHRMIIHRYVWESSKISGELRKRADILIGELFDSGYSISRIKESHMKPENVNR